MDAIDQQLLALLRENARAPTAELARRLSLSRTTVQSRIERLERGGVILGYSVRTGAVHSTAQVRALVMIVAAPRLSQAIESALRRSPQVRTSIRSAASTISSPRWKPPAWLNWMGWWTASARWTEWNAPAPPS